MIFVANESAWRRPRENPFHQAQPSASTDTMITSPSNRWVFNHFNVPSSSSSRGSELHVSLQELTSCLATRGHSSPDITSRWASGKVPKVAAARSLVDPILHDALPCRPGDKHLDVEWFREWYSVVLWGSRVGRLRDSVIHMYSMPRASCPSWNVDFAFTLPPATPRCLPSGGVALRLLSAPTRLVPGPWAPWCGSPRRYLDVGRQRDLRMQRFRPDFTTISIRKWHKVIIEREYKVV